MNELIIRKFAELIKYMKMSNNMEKNKSIKTKNAFRIKKLADALDVIKGIDYEITEDNLGDVDKMPGIGKGSIDRIKEIMETGNLKEINKIDDKQEQVNELAKVIGIGESIASNLVDKYGITSVQDLIDRKDELPLNDKILMGLKYWGKQKERIPRETMDKVYNYLRTTLQNKDPNLMFYMCGSYRRGKQESGDIDVLLVHEDYKTQDEVVNSMYLRRVIEWLHTEGFLLDDLTEADRTKYMGFCKYGDDNMRIDIRMIGLDSYAYALLYFTGPFELNQRMRSVAKKMGYKLNEYGLYDANNNLIHAINEKEIFDSLGMDYIDPTDRIQ